MDRRVGVRELRQQASGVLREVAAGATVEVTDRGRPVARIVPVRAGATERLIAEGRATPPEASLGELMGALGLPAAAAGSSVSDALAELRADDR